MRIARRSFLLAASLAAAPTPAWSRDLSSGVFTHGVASGDPLTDSVILWTRFASSGEGRIGWEISEDETFASIAARGEAVARFTNDFCVKVDARGLQPGRAYFYRFLSASGPSVTGRTRTAPAGAAESLTIALFSCANYGYGYFHSYGEAAEREDIDLVIHAGDYIYEVQRGAYPSAEETVQGRLIDPVTETVSLSDYYQRYATYHTDADLLELRRLKPMSVIWDDHEIANDAWREGAQQHQPATEGLYTDRVAAATKAFFDWTPTRRPDPAGVRLYRSLDWGDLARVVLLDTRLIGRDEPLDYRRELLPAMAQADADAAALAAQFKSEFLDNPARTVLGATQERWLADTLAESKGRGQTWQVIAQQIIMGDQYAPMDMLRFLPDNVSPGSRQWFTTAANLAAHGLPWNLDNWNGYHPARARFLESCVANASNAIVLGGDSHNCWLNNLAAPSGDRLAAIEFAGGSVSSPGFERSLTAAAPGEREATMRAANPHLAFADLTNRGYAVLRFTRTACEAEWRAFPVAQNREPQRPTPIVTRMAAVPSAAAGPGPWSVQG